MLLEIDPTLNSATLSFTAIEKREPFKGQRSLLSTSVEVVVFGFVVLGHLIAKSQNNNSPNFFVVDHSELSQGFFRALDGQRSWVSFQPLGFFGELQTHNRICTAPFE